MCGQSTCCTCCGRLFVQPRVAHVACAVLHLLSPVLALCAGCQQHTTGLTTGDFGWGSPTFAKMGRQKINLISAFLKLGVQVG